MERATRGEKIIAVSGALLLITSWLPLWAKYEYSPGSGRATGPSRVNAWSGAFNVLPKLALVIVLLVLGVIVLRIVVHARLPWPPARLYMAGGALAAILLLLTALVGPSEFGYSSIPGFEHSRGPMLMTGWILAAAIAYGGFLHARESEMYGVGSSRPPQGPVVIL